MIIQPHWEKSLSDVFHTEDSTNNSFTLPISPQFYRNKLTYVTTSTGLQDLTEFIFQRPLSHIGIDTEYKFNQPLYADNKTVVYDIRSTVPLLLSLTLAEPKSYQEVQLYDFVIDLRSVKTISAFQELFNHPLPYIGHNLKVELFCLWQLELVEPRMIWDTFIFEKALNLGRYNRKYLRKGHLESTLADIQAADEKREIEEFSYSLSATCQRYGVPFSSPAEKKRLQESFLYHDAETVFSEEQLTYAAADAHAAARLFFPQVQNAAISGILQHVVSIEMPWVITNASMEWRGLRTCATTKEAMTEKISDKKQQIEKDLENQGLSNSRSHEQLQNFFQSKGLLHHFKKGNSYCFDKQQIRDLKHVAPILNTLATHRRVEDLLSDKIIKEDFVGNDGRIHPTHIQLGTDTGRQTSKWPNILGMDHLLRPIIIPTPGYSICEADWSQKEVGVAGGVYNDKNLRQFFNSGDVYTAMAKQFFRASLPKEALSLSDQEFKSRFPHQRSTMKTCTLGMLYGMSPYGLAAKLKISETKAKRLSDEFIDLFPDLKRNSSKLKASATIRGYACTITGLRRYRLTKAEATKWELNWLSNHPIQGSAAVIFKSAGNRLHTLFKTYGAHLLIPLHDSFVFEVPTEHLAEIVTKTKEIMIDEMKAYFPGLQPNIEVNLEDVTCWNKDGSSRGLDDWLSNI